MGYGASVYRPNAGKSQADFVLLKANLRAGSTVHWRLVPFHTVFTRQEASTMPSRRRVSCRANELSAGLGMMPTCEKPVARLRHPQQWISRSLSSDSFCPHTALGNPIACQYLMHGHAMAFSVHDLKPELSMETTWALSARS